MSSQHDEPPQPKDGYERLKETALGLKLQEVTRLVANLLRNLRGLCDQMKSLEPPKTPTSAMIVIAQRAVNLMYDIVGKPVGQAQVDEIVQSRGEIVCAFALTYAEEREIPPNDIVELMCIAFPGLGTAPDIRYSVRILWEKWEEDEAKEQELEQMSLVQLNLSESQIVFSRPTD